MKKNLIALMALAGVTLAETATPVESSITLDGTQSTDIRLDFKYSTNASQQVTTTVDSVTIYGCDGYGLNTTNATITFNVQNKLVATNAIKLPYGAENVVDSTVIVNTALTDTEKVTLNTDEIVSRQVITADYFEYLSKGHSITLNLEGMSDFANGGVVFYQSKSGKYYAYDDISFSGDYSRYATIKAGAEALELSSGTIYTTLTIEADSGASVKGIGFVVTGPVPAPSPSIPEPATATLSLLALAGLAARRRRK